MFKKENLRKNFLRVKQMADQNLGRVERTEVLTVDLQSAEKKVEYVKSVCSSTIKKLSSSLVGFGTADQDKRLKKMPEAIIGQNMYESAELAKKDTESESIMRHMFKMCAECENSLAASRLQYELDVETQVLNPMQEIVENEIPQVTKLKKALNKLTLDMDSAKNRLQNATRQGLTPGVNMQKAAAQVDTVKVELDEAMNRVDVAKYDYATALFNFISKEADYSQNLLNFLLAQQDYHKKALSQLEEVIPSIKDKLSCNAIQPVYGVPLEEHLCIIDREIAVVIEMCVSHLFEVGLEEEGLFRIAGMASKVKKLKASFDAGQEFLDSEIDVHTVAGALKQYLRELPEPLLTFALYKDFVAAVQQPADQRLQSLWCVVNQLPKPNKDNFRYLIKFLAKLAEKSDVNKMTTGNIAIVIGPNLIWPEGDNGPNMLNTGILSLITELIIQHANWFFPGEINFGGSSGNGSPQLSESYVSQEHVPVARTTFGQSSSASVILQSVPVVGHKPTVSAPPQTPPTIARSASFSPHILNVTTAPIAESEDLQLSVQKPIRKPAPSPPERLFSVASSASMKSGQHASQYQTWPRQAIPPLQEDRVMELEQNKNKKPALPDRPNPPEWVSSFPGHGQSDRPKIPPPVIPPGHHRSASAGTPVNIPSTQLHHMLDSEDLTGTTHTGNWNQPNTESQCNQTNQLIPQQTDKLISSSLNKQTYAHYIRNMPLPPPLSTPLKSTIVEEHISEL